jgi:thiamine-monophosphate kinase
LSDRLGDLGERRIISELLAARYRDSSVRFGDDCAEIAADFSSPGHLLVTTDPCPPPMALSLGFTDEYYRGWLLATINLSDLAAAGARPLGLLSSLQLPAQMPVDDLGRLLDGLDQCADETGTTVVGGNLKEAEEVDVSATAVGWCDSQPLSRVGAQVGDSVLLIGEIGEFWAGVLAVKHRLIERDAAHPLLRNVLTPRPKVAAGIELRRRGLLSACLDNSDGLFPSLTQLGEANTVAVCVERDRLAFPEAVTDVASRLETDPLRLALGWGDWQLVATCPPDRVSAAIKAAESVGESSTVIGTVEEGSGVWLAEGSKKGRLLPLDSQRFAPDSWFSAGIAGYIETMLVAPLFSDD